MMAELMAQSAQERSKWSDILADCWRSAETGLLRRYVQLCSHLLRYFVNCTHLGFGGSLEIGRLQGHFAREQQCRHSPLQLTSQGLLRALASKHSLLFAPMQCCANLAYQPLHPANREVDMDGNRHAKVFEDGFALVRFGFKERLVDDDCRELLCAQVAERLAKRVSDLSNFCSRLVERFCPILSSRRRRDGAESWQVQ